LRLTTKNVAGVHVSPKNVKIQKAVIDGQSVPLRPDLLEKHASLTFMRHDDGWRHTTHTFHHFPFNKHRYLQGPIDDAFMSRFVVVAPSGKSKNAAFQSWVDFELARFKDRWRALMRSELPVVRDVDFDFTAYTPTNIVLYGDADSNAVIKQLGTEFPVSFAGSRWSFGQQAFDGDRYVPAMIFPSTLPRGDHGYIVLNSGLTFREGHDRTNSQQNPKLPDWAIIDITQPPDAVSPGRIHDADFFDENWKLKRQPKAP
jgi:hypothetical protein